MRAPKKKEIFCYLCIGSTILFLMDYVYGNSQTFRIQNVIDLKNVKSDAFIANHYVTIGHNQCYKMGINYEMSKKQESCICVEFYSGVDCGIPKQVWANYPLSDRNFVRRQAPRRVIMGITVLHECMLTEVRFHELASVVDVFIISESNITSGGDTKEMLFWNKFHDGYLSEFHHKIIYVPLLSIPQGYINDGWLLEMFIRQHWSEVGLSKVLNIDDDDIVIASDADEILSPEVLLFIKLYDGWDDPITATFRWTVFNFYWQHSKQISNITVGSTYKFLRNTCHNNIYHVRSKRYHKLQLVDEEPFKTSFLIGNQETYAGFHCSWCLSPHDIRTKLLSAQKDDKPRWGDFPEKTSIEYITYLTMNGIWFDDKETFRRTDISMDPQFAPKYILDNHEKYKHWLKPNK